MSNINSAELFNACTAILAGRKVTELQSGDMRDKVRGNMGPRPFRATHND